MLLLLWAPEIHLLNASHPNSNSLVNDNWEAVSLCKLTLSTEKKHAILMKLRFLLTCKCALELIFIQKGPINNTKLLSWRHRMLKILQYSKYNYTLHSPNHREQSAAIEFGGKHAMRWFSEWTGKSSKQHPTRGRGADLCCRNSYKGLHFHCPSFASSQTYPAWSPAPPKSRSFSPHYSTHSSLKAFYQWVGSMTGLSGFGQNTWTHTLCAFYMEYACVWPAVTSGLGCLIHVPSASRPFTSYVTLGNLRNFSISLPTTGDLK